MAKIKTKWICQNCGYETPKYIGKCPDCNSWGTLVEEIEVPQSNKIQSVVIDESPVCLINEIEITESIKVSTCFEEFDLMYLYKRGYFLCVFSPHIFKTSKKHGS